MKEFPSPADVKGEYGLFLIRQTSFVSENFLNTLFKALNNNLISFERLFKGNKCTLLIYGPKNILARFNIDLDLLEMEDYTQNINLHSAGTWEFALRGDLNQKVSLFENFPKLSQTEQFWWQIILRPILKKEQLNIQGNIRAVILSDDPSYRAKLVQSLQNLTPSNLIRLPKSYSNQQIMNFYKERNMAPTRQNLSIEQILKLIRVS